MTAYEFYRFDSTGGYHIIGVLPERRKNSERITQQSIINWGGNFYSKYLDTKDIFFIQVTIDEDTGRISRPIPFSIIQKEFQG
jgi:hypothetical protein